jgi:aldehyde:ferredoxin oxidoreductase
MREKFGGWTGKILRIDVTNRSTRIMRTKPYSDRFIGGLGIAAKIAWDEIKPEMDALDPNNKLIFSTGPLTGTLAPGSGRMEIVGKSPRTFPKEIVTRSGMGGYWGTEIKCAGYDAIVLEGEAQKPLYILIDKDNVTFSDANDLWGQDTFSTQKRLKERHGVKTQSICIGPAGENKSRIATIISETSFTSGKSGFGAVMGAKRVKAIAVQGSGGSIPVAHPGRLINLASYCRDLIGHNPMREWTVGYLPPDDHFQFYKKYRTGNASCFGCPLQCFAFIKVPGLDPGQVHCAGYYYMKPSYAYYGKSLEADQALWEAVSLCNKLGLCHFEMAGMVPWLRDLHAAGLLTDESSGLPLSQYGSKEFIVALLNSIAFRRNIGDILAEGAARAANSLPGAWSFYEKYYPAHGQSEHNSVRDFPGIALLWALDSRDPMIDHHAYRHLSVSRQRWPEPYTVSPEKAQAISERIFGSKTAIDHSTYAEKARAVAYCQDRSAIINSLVLCDWLYPMFISHSREDRMGDTSLESKLLSAVTGIETSEEELNRIGERIWNLMRAIMVREGRVKDGDTLHESYFRKSEKKRGGAADNQSHTNVASDQTEAIPRQTFEEAKETYYRIRGWDDKTGSPRGETLIHLGLEDIAGQLFHPSQSPEHQS